MDEAGEQASDDALEAGVTLLFFLGLSGVRNSVEGGGQDCGLGSNVGGGMGNMKLEAETVLPLFS